MTAYKSIRTHKSAPLIQPVSSGVTDITKEDTNDCALRAYCNVTGKSFTDVQLTFAIQGRKYKKGTPQTVLNGIYTRAGMSVTLMGSTKLCKYFTYHTGVQSVNNARTLKSLLADPKYIKGKHIFISKIHAMAVIDGKVIDTFASKESTRVYIVYSFE